MPGSDNWLNWQQSCKVLGCSRSHFYNLVKSGKLPSRRSGSVKGVKVTREDCELWLNSWHKRLECTLDKKI